MQESNGAEGLHLCEAPATPCRIKNNARTDGMVTIPADMLERLMNIAAQQKGVNDAPTLMLFAEVRRLIEEARWSSPE